MVASTRKYQKPKGEHRYASKAFLAECGRRGGKKRQDKTRFPKEYYDELQRLGPKAKRGFPIGVDRDEHLAELAIAEKKAERLISRMGDETVKNAKFLETGQKSDEVLRDMATQALCKTNPIAARIQAARLYLDFTTSRPATDSNVNVYDAETWLAEVEEADRKAQEGKSEDIAIEDLERKGPLH